MFYCLPVFDELLYGAHNFNCFPFTSYFHYAGEDVRRAFRNGTCVYYNYDSNYIRIELEYTNEITIGPKRQTVEEDKN